MVEEASKCQELMVDESVAGHSFGPKEKNNNNLLASAQPTPMKDTPESKVPEARIKQFVPILIELMSGS